MPGQVGPRVVAQGYRATPKQCEPYPYHWSYGVPHPGVYFTEFTDFSGISGPGSPKGGPKKSQKGPRRSQKRSQRGSQDGPGVAQGLRDWPASIIGQRQSSNRATNGSDPPRVRCYRIFNTKFTGFARMPTYAPRSLAEKSVNSVK